MGCSPSKGKLFLKPEARGLEKALLAEEPQDVIDSRPVEEENCLTTDAKENEPTEEHLIEETAGSQLALNTTDPQNAEEIKETGVAGEVADEVVQLVKIKRIEKRKKNKGQRRSLGKQKSSIVQAKMDFPPNMVRAHQAAYAFLNPNISKYETLLNLLDQAAQTQLSLQPLMSALVLRFEEINQGLEEMAEEGELMLKEHGDYMALPSGMLGPVVMQAKPSTATVGFPNPPPDLLQQLLQHSTEKMRLVGGSVQALGDTTLEEAAEYFSSLSNLLVEKLQAKQSAEQRLAQVLAWVEGAAIRKSHPEDSALHSEDSGIGGENESLTGSERHRHHRGSAGSGSCGSGINIRGAFETLPSNLPNLAGHNEDDEEDEEEDDDDDEEDEDEDDEGDQPERKRQDADMAMQVADQKPDTDLHPEMDKANCLYQQARKSIHLRNAAEGCDKRNIAELSSRGPSPFQARLGQRCESNEFYEDFQALLWSDLRPLLGPHLAQVLQEWPWGETSRGRLSMRRIDNSTRRTQSESPSLISHSEFTKNDSSVSSQAKGNESVTTKFRPGSPLMTGDNTQLDSSATLTTA
ncbi:hypothetical protein D9C73_010079 [Collichthys lucidus]|uniref:Photoreceptor cilium actin regulator n=1 Tax=Collichthys lucidus TaxID=240159 RepID=A0A4U5UN59_COLLU|nr:hypothetical protein D9C73_010079 [Collichthys lucidus]